jgi:hypothetical protein
MKKSIFMLVFAAFIGFAANAQNQKTTTGSTTNTAKPATTTTTTKTTTTTQTQAPKPAALKVPSAVETAFKAKYASATPTWSMKGSDYQAKFKVNNEDMKANFDATGKWLQTETKIASTSLPAAVQTSIKTDFADYKTESAAKLQSATTGSGYCATVAKGTEKYDVVFGSDGKVVSKTKM